MLGKEGRDTALGLEKSNLGHCLTSRGFQTQNQQGFEAVLQAAHGESQLGSVAVPSLTFAGAS